MNIKEFIQSIRDGAYTSIGSYPKFWITSTNEAICYQCIKDNCLDMGRAINRTLFGRIVGCDINWESQMDCNECSAEIESAYN